MKYFTNNLKYLLASLILLPVSALAETKLEVEPFTIQAGETKDMFIDLVNPDKEITAVQFDLELPEGLSIPQEDDEYLVDIAGRTTLKKHSLDTYLNGGVFRFLLSSTKNSVFEGTSGAIIKITLVASQTFKSGTITLSNIRMASPDESEVTQDPITIVFKEKLLVTVTIDDASRKYGAANPAFTYKTQPEGIDLTGKLTYSCSATATSNVGQYDITATSSVGADTTVTIVPGKLTVTPAPLKVIAKDATRTYGAKANYEFDYEGFVNGDTKAVVTTAPTISTTATSSSPVGTYDITPTGGSATNYQFTEYVGGKLTITKASLIATSSAYRTYGSENPTLTISYTGFVNNESASVLKSAPTATTTATKSSPVGYYPIVVSGGEADNYTIECKDGTLAVAPATLIVSAGNASRVYGASNPTFTYSISGFVNDETEAVLTTKPTVATAASETTGIGSYAIKAYGAAAQNYDFYYYDGILTITKAPLKATVKDATCIYGGTPDYEVEYSGFVNGDNKSDISTPPTVTSTATKTSPVGEYTTSLSGGSAVNYQFTEYVGGKLTITKAPLTVTANDVTWVNDTEWPTFGVTYQGFVLNEDESVLTKKPVAETTATKDSAEGTYAITVSGGEATNYAFEYVAGTLTIKKAEDTAVGAMKEGQAVYAVYDMYGRKIADNVTSLDELPKGVYIIGGRKVIR